MTEQNIRTAIAVIRESYIDADLAEQTAAKIEEYLASDVGRHRMGLNTLSLFFWDINAIITSTTRDLHFLINESSARGVGAARVVKRTPHYLGITQMKQLGDEQTRAQIIDTFKKLRDPLIIDLRGCSGGDAETVYFLLCHFIPDGQPLFQLQYRGKAPIMFKSAPRAGTYDTYNTVTKFSGAVRVVVDSHTYSGGEMLAKVLQTCGRAKVYGTTTPGAFNITRYMQFGNIELHLPYGRILDARTGQDYDKVGVVPDFGPTTKEYIKFVFGELSDNIFTTF